MSETIIVIAIVMLSVVLHEVAHGYMANALGDPTARLAGRLTLNPISHLDLIGSIIVPTVTWLSGGFIFGWAKPVPYNPYNLRAGKWSEAYVALAGPATNLLLALIFGLLVRFAGGVLPQGVLSVAVLVVVTNIALMVFNLIPVPPLDGSKVLMAVLPLQWASRFQQIERFGFIFVFIVVIVGWRFIAPLVGFLFTLITGISF
ncbi:MAG: site-2 protease family protein [Candidatus Campbellbacteria bacterium]|nr:site-2 protease family protein [Candidatus Campbellbacteria bacterium]